MRQIKFPLKLHMKGSDVSELHEELISLGYPIGESEKTNKLFGTGTRQALLDFQQKHGIQPSGELDKVTSALISQGKDVPQFIVQGVIRTQQSTPRQGLTIKAFDRNIGTDDMLLGQTITDDRGNYSITYTTEQLTDKAAADIIISVYQGNILLQTSDVIFSARKVETKDLIVPEQISEWNRLTQKIKSLLRPKVAIDEPSETQDDFLNK